MTLKQFGLPIKDTWSGDKTSYTIKMIEDASDKTLAELAEHFGLRIEQESSFIDKTIPSFGTEGTFRVFVSHLAAHRKFAAELQTHLVRVGISCFVAHNDIEPTQEWQKAIEAALDTCDALVALLHPNFHGSYWTDQEIGFAMGRKIPVFTVRLGQDPYGFIQQFQAFNGLGKSAETVARELFEAYRKHALTEKAMAEALINLFEQSGSFAQAKERMGYLEKLNYWTPEFSERTETASKTNSQIRDSFGVPRRVKALIKQKESEF